MIYDSMPEPDLSTIIEIICRVSGAQHVNPDQDFYEIGITSVQALPLLMDLEEQFNLSIPDERFVNARTARALRDVIQGLKKD